MLLIQSEKFISFTLLWNTHLLVLVIVLNACVDINISADVWDFTLKQSYIISLIRVYNIHCT